MKPPQTTGRFNQAGADLLGYSPDEVLGRNMHYLMHHSHADCRLMPISDCRIYSHKYSHKKGGQVFASSHHPFTGSDAAMAQGCVVREAD